MSVAGLSDIDVCATTDENWTDDFTLGQLVTFHSDVDHGEYLFVACGETGTVTEAVRKGHLRVSVRLHRLNRRLEEDNVLRFDSYCEDILESLRPSLTKMETNSNVATFPDGLAVPNTA